MRELSSSEKISISLTGKIGENARRWKGMKAGYVAKHMWIIKHYGNASCCENLNCKNKNPKRFEWANISGEYKRERDDYMQLCPSCHRVKDKGDRCKKGHLYTKENTYIRKEGWRVCRICIKNNQTKYLNKCKEK